MKLKELIRNTLRLKIYTSKLKNKQKEQELNSHSVEITEINTMVRYIKLRINDGVSLQKDPKRFLKRIQIERKIYYYTHN
jgi:hypothetical protein